LRTRNRDYFNGLTKKKIIVPGPVAQNGGIQNFTATCAFPCIKGPDEIVELLGKHAAFASRAFHRHTLHWELFGFSGTNGHFTIRANVTTKS
jgi:hypothetical protein